MDQEALNLVVDAVLGQVSKDAPNSTPKPAPSVSWSNLASQATKVNGSAADLRSRAAGAILGGLTADAAAMGIQWIYDGKVLDDLDAKRGGSGALDFYEPPQSPFLPASSYRTGNLTPYGEQNYALLKSVAQAGGFDAEHYAQTNFLHFASAEQARSPVAACHWAGAL